MKLESKKATEIPGDIAVSYSNSKQKEVLIMIELLDDW